MLNRDATQVRRAPSELEQLYGYSELPSFESMPEQYQEAVLISKPENSGYMRDRGQTTHQPVYQEPIVVSPNPSSDQDDTYFEVRTGGNMDKFKFKNPSFINF